MTIRQNLLASLLIGAGICTVAADVAGRLFLEPLSISHSLDRMRRETTQLASDLDGAWPPSAQLADGWAARAAANLGARITLVDPHGQTLADSQMAPGGAAGEPRAAHREVIQALERGQGGDFRFSVADGRELHYVASRVGPAEAPRGVVRMAVSDEDLRAPGRRQRRTATLICLAGCLVLAAIARATSRRVTRSLSSVTRAAEAATEGRVDARIQAGVLDEIARLASAVERMRLAMAERVRHAESDQRLHSAILAGLREGILVVNADRRVLLVNASLRRTLNLPESEPGVTPLIQMIWDRDVVETFDEALSRGDEVRRRFTLPDGVAFELTVVPLEETGSGPGALGLFFNVTRLEALERVRRDFVADISHELRTPLASVKAAAETLQDGAIEDRAEASRFLAILAKNALRMEAILDDLTDLSRIETGAIQLSLEPVGAAGAVREATAAVAARAAARQVTLTVEVDPDLTLSADRRRLDQILINLLDNAVKFNRTGGSVTIRGGRTNGSIRLTIEDTGPGIPPDALERIFNRFYRLDRARSRDVPGTGLGLAIVKHLVRMQGGDIRAENLPGTGARFILDLPAHTGRSGEDSAQI